MAMRLSPVMMVMQTAAQKAAKRLLRDFNEVEQLQVSIKGPGDFVSQADLRAEQTLREELERARPGYAFLMEESGKSGGDNWTWRWIVDPLDGTTNFLHGIPHWAISIGLQRRLPDGKIELAAGLVYNPASNEMFWAEKGTGAFLNERRIRVSAAGTCRNPFLQRVSRLQKCLRASVCRLPASWATSCRVSPVSVVLVPPHSTSHGSRRAGMKATGNSVSNRGTAPRASSLSVKRVVR